MKQINEAKEKLPIDFIAQFISKGWDDIGSLKASIDGIKREFSGTDVVIEILNNFMDAYLIAIGQMEEQAGKKIDMPEKEELKEALFELEEPSTPEEPQEVAPLKQLPEEQKIEPEVFAELPDYEVEVEQKGDKIEIELEPKKFDDSKLALADRDTEAIEKPVVTQQIDDTQPFEYFIDFDEPEADEEATEKIRAWQAFKNN